MGLKVCGGAPILLGNSRHSPQGPQEAGLGDATGP